MEKETTQQDKEKSPSDEQNKAGKKATESRQERLARQLRANLRRRKEQARQREH